MLRQIADYYLLHGLLCNEIGLLKGKTGMVIFFFHMSRYTGIQWYEDFARELLENVCDSLSQHSPITFADGLCGIGWAIEFLKKEGFIEGDTDEILKEIDERVMERDVRRITDTSMETGLAGIVAYIRSRLDSKIRDDEHYIFDNEYLAALNESSIKIDLPKYTYSYDIDSIWKNYLLTYWSNVNSEEISWGKGLVILHEQTCPVDSHIDLSICEVVSEQYLYENMLINSHKKTLLIFTEEGYGASYGVGTYIRYLIQSFDLSEWNILVIKIFLSGENVSFCLRKEVAYYGIPRLRHEQYLKAVFYYLTLRLSKKIYCHFNFFGKEQLAYLLRKSLNAHIVFTLHYMTWRSQIIGGVRRIEDVLKNPINEKDMIIKTSIERERNFMMECCDRIIAVSQHSYDTLHQLYKIPLSKLSLVSNAVQDSVYSNVNRPKDLRCKYGFSETEKIILYVGRIEKNKGIFDLMLAFKEVLKEIPDARLLIAGNGDLNGCMESIYPLNKFVTYYGFISPEILHELYSIANVGVIPSVFEEFGYVAAEMMLNKCPIIIRNNTGLKEITCNGKFAISHFQKSEDLAKIIVANLLNCYTLKDSLEEGRNRILEEYSQKRFNKQIKDVFKCM